ncbi:MAG: hypothetical protein K0U16_07625 [Gammaproteobacteria bacterium]|nr:hypothetical protein [Gammaproteobacteria bacterium]
MPETPKPPTPAGGGLRVPLSLRARARLEVLQEDLLGKSLDYNTRAEIIAEIQALSLADLVRTVAAVHTELETLRENLGVQP